MKLMNTDNYEYAVEVSYETEDGLRASKVFVDFDDMYECCEGILINPTNGIECLTTSLYLIRDKAAAEYIDTGIKDTVCYDNGLFFEFCTAIEGQ